MAQTRTNLLEELPSGLDEGLCIFCCNSIMICSLHTDNLRVLLKCHGRSVWLNGVNFWVQNRPNIYNQLWTFLIALFSGANTLAPLSHTDLPRHLRSTRRLSVCNEQIMMELQQKMHNPSSNPDGSSSKRLVRVWAIRCYWNIKFISGSLSVRPKSGLGIGN